MISFQFSVFSFQLATSTLSFPVFRIFLLNTEN